MCVNNLIEEHCYEMPMKPADKFIEHTVSVQRRAIYMCSTSKMCSASCLDGIRFKYLAMQPDVNKKQTVFKCEFKQ